MKSTIILSFFLTVFCFRSLAQYTPLPALDPGEYDRFVAFLNTEAAQQDLPELKVIADNMTYDEARRFMANPHVFAEKLKNQVRKEGDPAVDAIRIGFIINILINHFTNIGDSYSAVPRLGAALGLYALFTFGSVYVLTEIFFAYRVAGEKYKNSSYDFKTNYRLSYAMFYASVLWAFEMTKLKLLLGIGPALGYALSGKQVEKDSGQTNTYDIEFGDNGWKRMQAGLSMTVGFLTQSGMLLYLNYCLFLSKIYTNSDVRLFMLRLGLGIPFDMFSSKKAE